MKPRATPLASLAVLAALAPGCVSESPAAAGATTVRDSAGIEIVDNADAPGPADGWRLGEAPEVVIGALEGDPAYLLHQPRTAARLSDGRVVVANSGTGQLRFYDPEGVHLRSTGGIGEGPGEFQAIEHLSVGPGDTLFAYDLRARRLSVFGPDGDFVRSFQPPGWDGRFPRVDGLFGDGSLLTYDQPGFGMDRMGTMVDDPILYFRLGGTGAVLDTVGPLPGRPYYVFEIRFPQGTGLSSLVPPFAPTPRRAVAPDRFYSSAGGRYEIAVHAPDGRLRRLVRLDRQPAPVSQDDAERFRAPPDEPSWDPTSPFARARLEAIDHVGFPEVMPTHDHLLVASSGNLWVEDYRPFDEGEPRWTVFDPEGRLLGSVTLPAGLTVDQVGDGFVVGRRTDDLGVEYVEVWALVK